MADDLVTRAALFAERAHSGQQRKFTGEPYFGHCAEVAGFVRDAGGTPEMVAAAYLHDTVEDTDATSEEIGLNFGDTVRAYVLDLTSVAKDFGDRSARKAEDRRRLMGAPSEVKTIKLADVISNIATVAERDPDFARTYMAEKRDMLASLKGGDPGLFARASGIIARYFASNPV